MARETRATDRTRRTPKPTSIVSTGVTKTLRKNATTTAETIAVPDGVESAMFRNAGDNDLRIRINANGANFWTLKPGEVSPKVLIGGSTIDYMSVGGDSVLESLLEG